MIPQRLYSFLVVFLLMFLGTGFGQQKNQLVKAQQPVSQCIIKEKRMPERPFQMINFISISKGGDIELLIKKEVLNNFTFDGIRKRNDPTKDKIKSSFRSLGDMVPASFYVSQLGIICKAELQLDKITTIPLRFRLGSLAYVNYLEQKPNAINPHR